MIYKLLNSLIIFVLFVDMLERRFPNEVKNIIINVSLNCIYHYSKFQIFLSIMNRKINKYIESNEALLKIKCELKSLMKTLNHSENKFEYVKNGNKVTAKDDYDFIIYSWEAEDNKFINKKITLNEHELTIPEVSDSKFIWLEIKIDDNLSHKIDLKTDDYNYYIVGNIFNKQFFLFYLKNYLNIKAELDNKFNLKIIDQDVNNIDLELTDKNYILMEKNGYKLIDKE